MPNFNQVTLMGRLTRNPELRYTSAGTPITDINVAVDDPPRKDRERHTNFFFVTLFGKQAESVAQYMVKGQEVLVNGRLHLRQWEDQEGTRRSRVDVIGQQVTFGHKPRKESIPVAA